MAEVSPWLTLVGLGEDGPDGLSAASRAALAEAEVVIGPPRHLSLVPDAGAERIEWPVPFADGLTVLDGLRGRRVVALVSGDPFWFGAGRAIAARYEPGEWCALPVPSTFSLAASRLGWSLEDTLCLGLHAAPLERVRPHLAPDRRAIVLLRDGDAVRDLARYLTGVGFGASTLHILEALGGPRERITPARADALPEETFAHPVAVALAVVGEGRVVPVTNGLADEFFESDGQITKRPVRALALSALAPRPGELLWDIGGGSGSISVEWCLSHPSLRAICIEPRADRAARIGRNAATYGLDRLSVVEGAAPEALDGLDAPGAVFVGGGLTEALLADLENRLSPGTRLVAHSVTLETEALLTGAASRLGGTLMRVEISEAAPLGPKRGWKASYPVVQWQVVL
ncbi:precorrin-6y C5,15-methyltransferase (decarboxylating) subunit CbiE [Alphaproteobacteria bacterium GH1-50]|uniref:Precorrin-6y C5,15-methyltransferase (Decarboxylating) subunit CbiE n=1 Tax=Kangsaoukella pontilimi TaxID=2691042 RepID=A0A7C9NFY9_9RHOB|nr:precorrin-6y C5,15-methyltransferase (decarboxylating) subunit CbiE [Kangsaoukella pontilimi]MXQ09059.1 precorrin-6y C5,15-methyltransferase (decarboxylating) subunit CbiE [Kangsaoukella pontilimi]